MLEVNKDFYGEPKWGPIGREVFDRTYSRVKSDGTSEEWFDTVKRVVEGNTGLVGAEYIEPFERTKLFDLIYNFKILPGGRHLWVSGVEGRQFLFNCHRSAFTQTMSEHYAFAFDQLMQGGGVGANYSNRYINVNPKIQNKVDLHITCDSDHPDIHEFQGLLSTEYSTHWGGSYRVPDTREGWTEALVLLMDAFFTKEYQTLVLDVSLIRERGRLIRGFGGIACGPGPLVQMLINVFTLMNSKTFQKLSSLEHMKIDHEIANCVVSGNVRRSARMSIKAWRDPDIFDFIECKKDKSQHWSTNISVEIDDEFFVALKDKRNLLHDHANNVYISVVRGMLTNGEPGFYNLTRASEGEFGDVGSTNPCGEIALEPWENCCLGHVNLNEFVNDFEGGTEAFRLMTRFLIRATFGDIPNEKQRKVVDRNRRIGVGFFGYQGWLVRQGVRYSDSHRNRYIRKTLKDWKSIVDKEKRRYAFQLRIPEPIKGTTIAPTGSITALPGATPAINTITSRYFIRRVRFASNDPKLEQYIKGGYPVEPDLYTPNTSVVSFYCKDPLVDLVADELIEQTNEVRMADMLAVQTMIQELWADNAVSFTVNVEPDETQKEDMLAQLANGTHPLDTKMCPPAASTLIEATKTIMHYLPYLKGTTIMVDGSRPQSPYESITKADFELQDYLIRSVGQSLDDCVNGCPVK